MIVELSELTGFRRAELAICSRRLISRSWHSDGANDGLLPIGANPETALRRCILVGTGRGDVECLPNDPVVGTTRALSLVQCGEGSHVEAVPCY